MIVGAEKCIALGLQIPPRAKKTKKRVGEYRSQYHAADRRPNEVS